MGQLRDLAHHEWQLAGEPFPVRTAQRLVHEATRGTSDPADPVCALSEASVLVAGELVTAAMTGGAHLVVLQVELDTDRVEVGVIDDGPPPARMDDDADGRLQLVPALASSWGVRELPHRTWRWARLTLAGRPAAS